jgi:hypothetical protein
MFLLPFLPLSSKAPGNLSALQSSARISKLTDYRMMVRHRLRVFLLEDCLR